MKITKKDAAFYCFENVALAKVLGISKSDNYLGEQGVKDLMKRISDSFGMECPTYKNTRKDSSFCYYKPCEHAIYYNVLWGLTSVIVLHEMAHSICCFLGSGLEAHGPKYVRVWIDIFARMYEIDPLELEKIADERGLPFTPRKVVKPVTMYVPKYG